MLTTSRKNVVGDRRGNTIVRNRVQSRAPALAAAGFLWEPLQLWRPLRAVCLAVAVLILADPQVRRQSDGLDLWVLVDQSDSAWEETQPRLQEWQTILETSKGVDDRIFYVDFANEAVTRGALLRGGAAATAYSGKRSATRRTSGKACSS